MRQSRRTEGLGTVMTELAQSNVARPAPGNGISSGPSSPFPLPAARSVPIASLLPATRFFLAPLAGYTNWPFRVAVREVGGIGLATTDLVNARALLRASPKSLELIHTSLADRPLA